MVREKKIKGGNITNGGEYGYATKPIKKATEQRRLYDSKNEGEGDQTKDQGKKKKVTNEC